MPPGSAKSTYCSKLFPAWLLGGGYRPPGPQQQRIDIIGASNTADLAYDFSGDVQGFLRDNAHILETGLYSDAKPRWRTTGHGQYRAAGVGGTITGRRADVAIIDDPIRSREDADSELVREKQWKWLLADLRTRLKPHGAIVLILTHWHEDDMAGRAVLRQPGMWEVVRMTAIAEDPALAHEEDFFGRLPDPLGREVGEWLWDDDDYGYAEALKEVFDEYELSGAARDWAALYQQRPAPLEGVLFKVAMLGTIDAMPFGAIRSCRGWDLAATEKIGTGDPDWTVGVKMTRMDDGQIIVEDVVRERLAPEKVRAVMLATATTDGTGCLQDIPQDPGQAGKDQVQSLTRMLHSFRVQSSPESGDKATRAEPYISQVNVGNVKLLRGLWNQAYRNELANFGGGGKDDQVDASSRAYNAIAARKSIVVDKDTLERSRARAGITRRV